MDNSGILNDLEWDNDDESFKSAVEFSLAQPFLAYSTSVDPLPLNIGTSCHSDFFVDALSEEESDDEEQWLKTDTNDYEKKECTESTRTASVEGGEGTERTSQTATTSCPVDSSSSTVLKNTRKKETEELAQSRNDVAQHSISSYAFNQDRDCIVISTTGGYQIQTLEVDPNDTCQIHKVPILGGVSQIEILHRTSLVAIVKNKSPRSLSIIHAKTALLVKELSFTSAVRRVEMNKIALLVLTADGELHCFVFKHGDVHFVRSIQILHENESTRMITSDAAATQGAFFELAPHCLQNKESWVVTKCADGIGYISVYKIHNGASPRDNNNIVEPSMDLISTFCAHNHSIARVAIGRMGQNSDDYVLATASIQGTIIRVFSLPQGTKLFELQRGSSAATIFSLSFNSDSSVLAVSSSKGTVHMFLLTEENRLDKNQDEPNQSANRSMLSRIVNPFSSNLKDDGQQPFRSFVKIRIKDIKGRTPNSITLLEATLSGHDGTDCEDNLVVCFQSGKLFHFAIPRKRKGKSRPVRAENLLMGETM